jgi:hypothetical protein
MRRTLSERFWSKVKKTKTCWVWTGAKDKDGYGSICVDWNKTRAHRVSWKLHHPDSILTPDIFVLHKCDNPPCVRPDHLFLGDQIRNIKDKVSKNRQAVGDRSGSRLHSELWPRGDRHHARLFPERLARGERSGMAKLNEKSVVAIRKEYSNRILSQRDLAKKYGVCQAVIRDVVNFVSWKHVTGEQDGDY